MVLTPHGFVDPPTQFVQSMLTKENVINGLARKFYDGDTKKAEATWSDLVEEDLMRFFYEEFGQGPPREERPYNFIIYGASGYTGSLVLEYIFKNVQDLGTKVHFALAGRSPNKLEARLQEVLERYPSSYKPDILRIDLSTPLDIRKMVLQCRTVINIAGPFMLTPADMLVEACVSFNCDYVDVNGEVPFTHKLLKYHDVAKCNEVIICPNAAGAGGIPDIGAYYTANELKKIDKQQITKMHMYLHGSTGGAPSGGTLATRAAMSGAMKDVASIMKNPFALGGSICGGDRPEDSDKNLTTIEYDPEYQGWSGPFTYAFFETRLIRRSNWLLANLDNECYGDKLVYTEHLLFPSEQAARGVASSNTNSKKEEETLREQGKLFKLGEGLSEKNRADQWTEYYFDAETVDGTKIKTKLVGKDGYDETAHVAVEMGLLLSVYRDRLPFKGGVLTPAVAGGMPLVEALKATGLEFGIVPEGEYPDLTRTVQ